MSKSVIDSSAILALLLLEPGGEKVLPILGDSVMSTVNIAEVFTKLAERELLTEERISDFYEMGLEIAEFDREQALKAAELRPITRHLGLSLGDRCCLALAMSRGAVAVTADRNWKKFNLCEVNPIR